MNSNNELSFSEFPMSKEALRSILIEERKSIIIFDGECNLCDFIISFLKKRNKNEGIFFLSFQTIVYFYFLYILSSKTE